jgi:hypothetical protein
MTSAELKLKKATLEKQVNLLMEQYMAVSNKLVYENNPATKVTLQKQASELLNDYGEKQTEVEQVTETLAQREQSQAGKLSSRQPSNRLHLHWEEHLCKIDFAKVSKLIPEIIRDEPQGVAAVFLLHDSYRMCGELCLRHITKYLADLSVEPPRHIEIGFSEYETPSALEFLRRIGKYKEIPTEEGLNTQVTAIIEKICSGLGNAGTVLIELKIRESLEVYEEFVGWFLCSFWEPLVNRLPQITAERRYIKLIALIHVRNPVPKKALSLYRCTPKEFHGTKLLDLPLEKWELRDIKAWLFKYSGLALPGSARTTEQIEKAATVIHKNGKWPNDVYNQIREMLGLQIEKAEEEC